MDVSNWNLCWNCCVGTVSQLTVGPDDVGVDNLIS
jgi:hypothetical protein